MDTQQTLRLVAVSAIAENSNPIQALVRAGVDFDTAIVMADRIWREGLAIKLDQLGNGLLTASGRNYLNGSRP